MRFDRINKRVSAASIFAVVLASLLLMASAVQAECNFFAGWVDNKDGTVRDPRNGIIWKRCAEGFEFANGVCMGSEKYATWSDAMEMAKQSQFLGESDWRLPTDSEFQAVMGSFDECKTNKTGEFAVSKAIAHMGGRFWSSSPAEITFSWDNSYAWYANFSDGLDKADHRIVSLNVRLVRTSQKLGGEIAWEFAQERADGIALYQRQLAEGGTRQSLLSQMAVVMELQRKVAEENQFQLQLARTLERKRLEQAQERKKLAAFRKSLREGDDTNCGPIIEVKGKLVKVSIAILNYGNEHWIKREHILLPDYGCRFVNGKYQTLE